jgi:hypothetical protein
MASNSFEFSRRGQARLIAFVVSQRSEMPSPIGSFFSDTAVPIRSWHLPSTLDSRLLSVLARSRTWSSTFAGSRAIPHTPRTDCLSVPRRGVEPRPAASKAAVPSITPAGPVYVYVGRIANPSYERQCPDLDSNQDLDLRRVGCAPLHHRDERADGWTCTSIVRFTRAAPFCSATSAEGWVLLQDLSRFTVGRIGIPSYRREAPARHRCKESNPAGRLWRPPAPPGAHR